MTEAETMGVDQILNRALNEVASVSTLSLFVIMVLIFLIFSWSNSYSLIAGNADHDGCSRLRGCKHQAVPCQGGEANGGASSRGG